MPVSWILRGTARPVHILNLAATLRRIVNMTTVAVSDVSAWHQRNGESVLPTNPQAAAMS
jgi:hypothetical protein